MKQLSAVEVHFLTAEMQFLVGSRLQQVYQPAKNELVLQFYVRNKGSALLKVRVPELLYLASGKDSAPKVSGFCSLLRSKLGSSTLSSISQSGFERIVQLSFSSKKGSFGLIFELFSKGNIILTSGQKIAAVQQKQHWSSRQLRMGADYALPPKAADPRVLGEKKLLEMLKSTNKSDLVRFLAIELSLGGLYAEELCLLAGVGKKSKPADVSAADAGNLLQALKKLLSSGLSPSVIYEGGKPINAVPVALSYYRGSETKARKTFSEALEAVSAAGMPSPFSSEISRLKAIIQQQEETIASARDSAEKNKRSGELIYENYQEVKDILEAVSTARKQGSWDAVKKLPNKKIRFVDEKSGRIAVEFQ
ncbi:NFACT family protein [Candidatus Woesearchaeota archaeon]|nr:NFACT family protein [Candidatus Woesearchaeota archaeon]